MLRKVVISLLAGAAVFAAFAKPGWQALAATEPSPFSDSDDDFLSDAIEWVVLTSANNPDTDGDQIPDFVEVVQRGSPRRVDEPLPPDQEMRIVMTGPQPGCGETNAWLHLMVRLVGQGASLTSFNAWLEMPSAPGVRFSFDMMSFGPPVFTQRDAGPQGLWMVLSVPLVSASLLHLLAPLSLHAESTIAGRSIHSAVTLFELQGELSTLVPYDTASYAVQAITTAAGGGGNLSNRVCLLDLSEVGAGPGGTIYEVVAARCEDCNEVECSPSCPQSVGWLVTIPGGLGTIGGD
jgi:hypothetical protein